MMTWGLITGGLGLGLLSSFHCVGMCGAMAFALPVQHLGTFQRNLSIALYHLGRVCTYSAMGALFGILGRSFYLAGWQQWISIAAGTWMLLVAMQYFIPQLLPQWRPLQHFQGRIAGWMRACMQKPSLPGFLMLGMANGLLPCGMVYIAVAGALTLPTVSASMLFMSLFGFGTLPAMMVLSYFGLMASLQMRNQIKKMVPAFVMIMGILLILRGLNLGIPWISPGMPTPLSPTIQCH